jgi:hypothetical protein
VISSDGARSHDNPSLIQQGELTTDELCCGSSTRCEEFVLSLSDISITFAWDNNHINLSSETVTFSGRRAQKGPRNLGLVVLVISLLIPKTLDEKDDSGFVAISTKK